MSDLEGYGSDKSLVPRVYCSRPGGRALVAKFLNALLLAKLFVFSTVTI